MTELHVDQETGLVRPGGRAASAMSRRSVLTAMLCLGGAAALGGGVWVSGVWRPLSADYVSDVGLPRTIELPDGSRAFLNARSAIDLRFDSKTRTVLLVEGQAYFEVAVDPNRPFVVNANGVSVTALGTAFDINRNLTEARAEITVTHHSVRVQSRLQAEAIDTAAVLNEGEYVLVDQDGRIGGVVVRAASTALAWRNGTYVAEDRPLEDVVSALSAYYRGVVFIESRALRKLRVNAVLDLRDPLGSLEALRQGLPLSVRHVSNYLVIISSV